LKKKDQKEDDARERKFDGAGYSLAFIGTYRGPLGNASVGSLGRPEKKKRGQQTFLRRTGALQERFEK